MESKQYKKLIILGIAALVLVIVVFSASSFAWFTTDIITVTETQVIPGNPGNDSVITSKATGKAIAGNFNLQISEHGGDGEEFTETIEARLTQVNSAEAKNLLPVSTSDLNTFFFNNFTPDGKTSGFTIDSNEEHFYHGVVYVRAKSEGLTPGQKVALYLDSSVGLPVTNASQELLNATRLGIKINGQSNIFYLSDTHNATDAQAHNTYINGEFVGDGKVLANNAGQPMPVNDPAIDISSVCVDSTAYPVVTPSNNLYIMEQDQVYRVDVYFYFEGCDQDCSDNISMTNANISLNFVGILK